MLLHDGVAQLMKPTSCSFLTAWLSWGGSEAARSKDNRTGAGSARDERPETARASRRGRVARERDGGWFARTGPGRARVTARERTGGRARAARTAGSRAAALPAGVWRAEGGGIQGGGVASGFFQPKRAELGSKTFWAGARARARNFFCLCTKSK